MGRYRLAVVGFALFAILLRYGCSREKVASVKTSPDKMTIVSANDPRVNAAIERAQASLPAFIAALQSPKPGQVAFQAKAKFTDAGKVEHIWLGDVSYDGTNFHGTIDNEPEMVHNVKNHEKVTVPPADISDWMYIENHKLVGGETFRVFRDSLSPAERAEFDKRLDFVVE